MTSQQPNPVSGRQAANPADPESSTRTTRVAFPPADPGGSQNPATADADGGSKKKKKHRAGRKKRHRRQSFAAPADDTDTVGLDDDSPSVLVSADPVAVAARNSLYRQQSGNRSNESLDSHALLDHRYHSTF